MSELRYCPTCATALVDRNEGGRTRRACPAAGCGFVFWGNPVPAVGALVEHEGEMILARNRLWPEGWFALVTGYLEEREEPKAAVEREVKEELGLDATEVHLIGNYLFGRKNEIMLCYHVVASGTITLGEELAEIRRYAPRDLKPWPQATGLAVADWMRGRGLAVEFAPFPPPAPGARSP